MKKLLSVLLVLTLMLSFASCAKPTEAPAPDDESPSAESYDISIAALKGPTAMGLAKLFTDGKGGANSYTGTVYGTADEVSAMLINGTVDIAAVPANLASIVYNKTSGGIKVLGINTLGVLYVVENGNSVSSVADLKGRTLYSTGQGTTPEFALNYILTKNGLDPATDLTIEYKTEATEIAALLNAEGSENVIAVLPQPYVASVMAKNPEVRIALSLTDEWDNVSDGAGSLVTGVTVVTAAALERLPAEAIAQFMDDYAASVEFANTNSDAGALIEALDIAPAAIASKALPYCNIVLLTGEELKSTLGNYLSVLYGFNPKSVGGALPDDGFFYE